MKILIFGTGQFFENRHDILNCEIEIVGFIDNDISKVGTSFYGYEVFPPWFVSNLIFDYILLMTMSIDEVTDQLLSYEVDRNKIVSYSDFIGEVRDSYERITALGRKSDQIRILIVYTNLIKGGAAFAAINAAKVLRNLGYNCAVAAERIGKTVCEELIEAGIDVIKTTRIYSNKSEDKGWIDEFDIIIANSIDMLPFAVSVSHIKQTMLWLHDPYGRMKNVTEILCKKKLECIKSIHVYSVSDVAKRNFQKIFPQKNKIGDLAYGIPDCPVVKSKTNKVIIALIGWFDYIKGQDIFLDACDYIEDVIPSNVEFWLIGRDQKRGTFDEEIMGRVKQKPNVKCIKHLEKSEILKLYSQIDIVVSASREDMLPTVLVEGFMNSKICITSDATGIAPYITDGKNGFVFQNEDSKGLSEILRWCIHHPEELPQIEREGRALYEKQFSLESFGIRLEKAIAECIDKKSKLG